MKHIQNLKAATAYNKKSGKSYNIIVDKYSKGYKVIDGADFLKGIRTYSRRLTSHTYITSVSK